MEEDIYKHWDSSGILLKYNNPRSWAKRFRSERYFLDMIFKNGMKVLDIGCATGDLYAGLSEKYSDISYTGIDISSTLIKRAKTLFPSAKFILGNILNQNIISNEPNFDLVTATGVLQHEPRSEQLLNKMISLTKNYGHVLFDLKLFHTNDTLRDISISYCDHEERVFFIVLNLSDLINFIISVPNIISIQFYGYYSGINETVRLPDTVNEEVCSAHVMLKVGIKNPDEPIAINFNLPDKFLFNYFKQKLRK